VLRLDAIGPVTVVRMEHGKVNLLDVEMLDALAATIDQLASGGTGAIVLTGNGRVFSAGVDLARVVEGGPAYIDRLITGLDRVFAGLFALTRPVVAAIDGAAIAGGCILACAADRRLMSAEGGGIGASEFSVGVAFPVAALEVLRHAYGPAAEEAVFTGRVLEPGEAQAIGLVHELVAAGGLLDRAVEVAGELGRVPAAAFALGKTQLRRPVIERIERDRDKVDGPARDAWKSPETTARLVEQLERLRARKG
jgi:enoyl-CoA hydratase/carnithine racemase